MFGRKQTAGKPPPRQPRRQPAYGYTAYPTRFWCSDGWYTCAHQGCQKKARMEQGPDDHDCCGRHRCGEGR